MASCQKLDAARGSCSRQLILLLLFAIFISSSAAAQDASNDQARLAAAQKCFDSGQFEQAAKLALGPASQPAELDFLAGMALAKLQRWQDARLALEAGHRKAPNDPRFLVELAGISYKQNDFAAAKRGLRAALRLDPRDPYTHEFLGTIYFIEGNLEAALKYWNAIDKPRLRSVAVQPAPLLDAALLNRAISFNAPQILTSEALLSTQARLALLGVFPHRRVELIPADGNYDAKLYLTERTGWGDSKLEGAVSIVSGLPYETVYPEFYNLGHRAMNLTSLLRWDDQKRRAFSNFSMPLMKNPALRFQAYVDVRNENWNLTNTFFGTGSPLSDLNIRRIAAGAEFHFIENGRWSWSTGIDAAHRSFRNLNSLMSASEKIFFGDGASFSYWLDIDRSLLRFPERRFTIDSSAQARLGRTFATGLGAYGNLRASVQAHWLPQAKGDDYEMRAELRTGGTLGRVPFDEFFQLGVERDNDLWLRGHAGTIAGRKGDAPLGRRYFLANWEWDKNIYANGFFTVKLGPFLDNGAIADSSGLFGSQRWLWDTGAQCKVRVLGSITVALIYGRDLRGQRNLFYATALH